MGKDPSKNTLFFSRCRCDEMDELQSKIDKLNSLLEIVSNLCYFDAEMMQKGEKIVTNCQSVFELGETLRNELQRKFSKLSQDVTDELTAIKTKTEEKIVELQDLKAKYQVEDDDYHNSLIIIAPIETSIL